LCLVDTGNQCIRRYTLDGDVIDVKTPFPVVPDTDTSGGYLHLNCLAQVDDRIGLMLHNGKTVPARKSEIAWLDRSWNLIEMESIDGYACHDIVADPQGRLWHSASDSGELLLGDGRRILVSDNMMTRAIAFCRGTMLVGLSSFGPRQQRDILTGQIILFDDQHKEIERMDFPSAPSDAIAIT
jgi:hypothetical protein